MNMEVWSRKPQKLLFSCFLPLCIVLLKAAFVQADYSENFKCPLNMTAEPLQRTKIPADRLLLSSRTNFTFGVKNCRNIIIILGVKDNNDYWITFDSSSDEGRLLFQKRDRCGHLDESLLNASFEVKACNESQYFSINWHKDVQVSDLSNNGTVFLNYSLQTQMNIDYVSVSSWEYDKNETDVIIDADCSKTLIEAETPSTVTQGHLAGAVIAALIAGILLGGAGVYFGPDLWEISKERLPVLWKRKENTADDAELSDLFDGKRAPTPEKSNTKDEENLEDKGYISMAVAKRRAPSNAYTPCTVAMATPPSTRPTGQRQGVSKSEGAKPTERAKSTPDVKRATVSQPKTKMWTKASAKPTKSVAKVHKEEEEPGEIYANEDAQVYEGMNRDLPIYENRNTGTYESLNVGK